MSSIANTALSGVDAANSQLSVVSNNIANASTTGFKSARISFADVYGLNSGSTPQVGSGVNVKSVVQDFTAGGITLTGKALDMSISNNNFFVLQTPAGNRTYTRDGQFSTDSSGNVKNPSGDSLMGYAYVGTGTSQVLSSALTPLAISTASSPPVATTAATTQINLNSSSTVPATGVFSPTDPTSYTARSDVTVYDSLGNSHTLSSFYLKTAAANTWRMYEYLDQGSASQVGPIGGDTAPANTFYTVGFNSSGAITNVGLPAAGTTAALTIPLANGAANLAIAHSFAGTTQYGSQTAVSSNTQDGNTAGTITGISVDTNGIISANFSNGTTNNLGKVALAQFTNAQGLKNLSNNQWEQTNASGAPIIQSANSTSAIQSGTLENSNVDLARNLVDLIAAQRFFQANTQAISVSSNTLDAIINIIR